MAKERFSLKAGANLMWTVKDEHTGVSIEFREGLFNESQEVNVPKEAQSLSAIELATVMREIGDWIAQEHSDIAL